MLRLARSRRVSRLSHCARESCRRKLLQSYLFIGGPHDGLNFPVTDDVESVKLPVAVTDKATYVRSTLSVGDVSITIYIHE